MWKSFGNACTEKHVISLCMKYTEKNCPFAKYTDQNTICFSCCSLTLDIVQAASQMNA